MTNPKLFGVPDRLEEARELDRRDVIRAHWTDLVDDDALAVYSKWQEMGAPVLHPVTGGRQMREGEAARFWWKVFEGQEM